MYCSLAPREVTFLTNVIEWCYWVTSRPFFKREHLLVVKTNQPNGKCFASSRIHPSIIIIILLVWPQALRCCSERRLSSEIPIDLFGTAQGSLYDRLGQHPGFGTAGVPESSWLLALMLEEEEAAWAFVKECTDQTDITSSFTTFWLLTVWVF